MAKVLTTDELVEKHENLMDCDDPTDLTDVAIDRVRRALVDRAKAGDEDAVEYIVDDLGYDLRDLTNFLRKN